MTENDPEPRVDEAQRRRRLDALMGSSEAVTTVVSEAMNDPAQREEFLREPAAFLRAAGIDLPGEITLTDRDRDILRAVADPEIARIYREGDVDQLVNHVAESFPALATPADRVGWAYADFHVIVEAAAIAIGVAVAPIIVADKVSDVARLESLFNARLAAQEERLRALEERLGD